MLTDRIQTTTTASTASIVNNGSASGTTGGAAYLQVFDVGSSGTVTVYVHESSTGAFAGEESTTCNFAAASSSETQRSSITSSMYQYVRCGWSITATTAQFAVALHGDGW